MRQWLQACATAGALAALLLTGCAIPPRTDESNGLGPAPWRGRLAVSIETDLPAARSFSASFELAGDASVGEMTLFTPLGNTVAVLSWNTQSATMRANGDIQYFSSLSELITRAIGTELPVAALFSWLAGDSIVATGWHADLSQYAKGRIVAKRTNPGPPAELRLVLER